MRRNKKKNRIMLLTLLILGISIGFAALATTLKINGVTNVLKPSWSVYWTNPVVTAGSVSNTLPTIGEDPEDPVNTKVTWQSTLALPGDFYEFTVDAINTGSVDAMITNIEKGVTDGTNPVSLPDYIIYSLTYDDGTEVELNHVLQMNSTQTYKIRIYYDISKMTADDINTMPAGGLSFTFSLEITYGLLSDEAIVSNLRYGEYFYMCPDKATATTDTPGFSGSTSTRDQCLWRVIKINGDGTIEAIADDVSSGKITISGVNGYKYYVAGLQDIALDYAKEGYTVKTRMMGYDGQTPVIQDTYAFNGTIYTAPSTTSTPSPTTGNGEEYSNGLLGDTLYLRDYQLVKKAYNGSASASSGKSYWLASRRYRTDTINFYFYGRYVNTYSGLDGCNIRYFLGSWRDDSYSHAVRPIITLRAGLTKVSGDGTSSNPYYLSNKSGWVLTNSITPLASQKSEYWENGSKIMNGWRHDLTDRSGRPNTYYFKDGYVYYGWLELDGKKYYLSTFDDDGNGYMDNRRFNGETREIDGVEYTFDANGVCTNCS